MNFNKILSRYITDEKLRKLSLGCGAQKIPGATNVDFLQKYDPDVIHDLNKFPWPFEDNSFSYIHASQVIEHLNDTIKVLGEIHRITEPEGIVYIGVPHYSSRIAFADPTHVRYFAATTFLHYFPSTFYMSDQKISFDVIKMRITFSKMYWPLGLPYLASLMPRFYEDHFAHIFPAKFIHVLLKVKKS